MLGLMQDWPLLCHRIIDHAAINHTERPIVSRSVEGALHATTYGEVRARALRLGQRLDKAGIRLGDRVATLAWNTWRHLEAWYGIMGIGAIYHTVNPRLFPDQIAWIVNHAEDRLMFSEFAGKLLSDLSRLARNLYLLQLLNMGGVMIDFVAGQPLPELLHEKLVFEVFAPKAAVSDSRLFEATVKVKQPDQAGPCPAPVRHRQNRSLVSNEPGKNMLAILPDRFGHNDRGLFRDGMEYLDSHPLAIDESMPLLLIEWVGSFHEKFFFLDRGDQSLLHRCLRRLTHLIRGRA